MSNGECTCAMVKLGWASFYPLYFLFSHKRRWSSHILWPNAANTLGSVHPRMAVRRDEPETMGDQPPKIGISPAKIRVSSTR